MSALSIPQEETADWLLVHKIDEAQSALERVSLPSTISVRDTTGLEVTMVYMDGTERHILVSWDSLISATVNPLLLAVRELAAFA